MENDQPVAESLRRGLRRYGFDVRWVTTGGAALAVTDPYDLVLLDLGLPDTDGLDVCRSLRGRGEGRGDVPIIVISARSDETDRVVGLEIGADDYVSKPFGVREVIARIRAVMRRVRPGPPDGSGGTAGGGAAGGGAAGGGAAGGGAAGEGREAAGGPQRYGPRLTVDRRAARVRLDGAEVALTPKEYDLLAFLTEEPGALMSREQIMEAVWDANWFGPTKTLDVHVAALRRKLAGVVVIEAVRGVGFRLDITDAASPDEGQPA